MLIVLFEWISNPTKPEMRSTKEGIERAVNAAQRNP